jgi:hypothetical protein
VKVEKAKRSVALIHACLRGRGCVAIGESPEKYSNVTYTRILLITSWRTYRWMGRQIDNQTGSKTNGKNYYYRRGGETNIPQKK